MTVYAYPAGRELVPSASQLAVRHNQQRTAESPLNGETQTSSLPGARWVWELQWPDTLTTTHAAALEAMVARLSGRQHRLALHDFKRPRPLGDIALAGVTLGAPAAQFATTLQLAGTRGSNLLQGPDFDFDTNADGTADFWVAYNTGNTGVITRTHDNTTAVGSGYSQTVACASMGGADTDRAGIVQILSLSGSPGAALAASAYAWGDTGGGALQKVRVWAQLWLAGVAGQVVLDSGATALTNAWARYSAAGVATQAFDEVRVYFWQQERPGGFGAATLHVDKAKLELAPAATDWTGGATLLAGDWLKVAGQVFMAAADAQADDAGTMAVEVRQELRAALSAGAVVTLDKPTALYVLADTEVQLLQRTPGLRQPGMRHRFVEVFS